MTTHAQGERRPAGVDADAEKIAALLVAAWTFVPSTLRRLTKGKIGVGTVMTIVAVGAVALDQFEEAATLAFLCAISEGLEEHSLAKTRRGLCALPNLVPAEATVLRNGTEVTRTAWMHEHLRVVAIPVDDADTLGQVETRVLEVIDPPLNFDKMARTDLRRRLTELRQ